MSYYVRSCFGHRQSGMCLKLKIKLFIPWKRWNAFTDPWELLPVTCQTAGGVPKWALRAFKSFHWGQQEPPISS